MIIGFYQARNSPGLDQFERDEKKIAITLHSDGHFYEIFFPSLPVLNITNFQQIEKNED
jgi:hypothetical protein